MVVKVVMVDGGRGCRRTKTVHAYIDDDPRPAFVQHCNPTRGGATQRRRRNSCSVSPREIPLRQTCLGMTSLFVDGNTTRRAEAARS